MVVKDYTVMLGNRTCISSGNITVRVRHITSLPSGYSAIGVVYANDQKSAIEQAKAMIKKAFGVP